MMSTQRNSEENKQSSKKIMDCDLIRQGFLHIKRPPAQLKIRFKAWKKRYFILKDDSFSGRKRLEMFEDDQASKEQRQEFVIDLRNISAVESYTESKNYPHAFTIVRKGSSPLVLAAESASQKSLWVIALELLASKEKNCPTIPRSEPLLRGKNRSSSECSIHGDWTSRILNKRNGSDPGFPLQVPQLPSQEARKGYKVQVVHTNASERNGLVGNYQMNVFKDALCLVDSSNNTAMEWPVIHIRKFKNEKSATFHEVVTLEASMQCGKSEGLFQFKTQHGKLLMDQVKLAVKRICISKSLQNQEEQMQKHLQLQALGKFQSDPCFAFSTRSKITKSDSCKEDEDTQLCNYPGYLQILPDDEACEEDSFDSDRELSCQNCSTSQEKKSGIGECYNRNDSGFFGDSFDDSQLNDVTQEKSETATLKSGDYIIDREIDEKKDTLNVHTEQSVTNNENESKYLCKNCLVKKQQMYKVQQGENVPPIPPPRPKNLTRAIRIVPKYRRPPPLPPKDSIYA